MSAGFYKRRRGVVEHIESGTIDLLENGIHDYLSLKANLVIGNGSSIPAGVCFSSAPALRSYCRRWVRSDRTMQRILEHMEQIGWIKTWPKNRGNYPTLICRATVHDLSGNEYRVNADKTTDWRSPAYEPVGELSATCPQVVSKVASLREVREENREKRGRKAAAKPARPADPRHKQFVDFAHRTFEVKYGQKPSWQGKDWKGLQNLLASNNSLGVDDLQSRWQNYLASTENFTAKWGGSLAYFCAHADSFITGPILEKGKINGNAKPTVSDAQRTTLDAFRQLESGKAN